MRGPGLSLFQRKGNAMTDARRASHCLDYHVRENFWAVSIDSDHSGPLEGGWRIMAGECLAENPGIDVRGATLDEALERTLEAMVPAAISEAMENTGEKDNMDFPLWTGRVSGPLRPLLPRVITWGRDADDKEAVVKARDVCLERLGPMADLGAIRQNHQDYRTIEAGERAKVVDELVRCCRAADCAIASVMAHREGITDLALQHVREAIAKAVEKA